MTNKRLILSTKLTAGILLLTSLIPQGSIQAEEETFAMHELAQSYWLYGNVEEGLCGARMRPNTNTMRKEASTGNKVAAFRLGQLYENGTWGVKEDKARAIKWYAIAAEQGMRDAQISLGVLYELGRGTPKDLQKARYWYLEAQKIRQDDFLAGKIERIEKESSIQE